MQQFHVITEFYYCFKSCISLVRLSYQKALLLRSDGEVTAYGRNLDGQGNIPVLEKDVCYTQVDEVHPSGSSLSVLIISMASLSTPG